jgi:hypothetical protein
METMVNCKFRHGLAAFAAISLAPMAAQADQWEPDVLAGIFPVSVIVRHETDGLEVAGPTGLRAIVFTMNGHVLLKDNTATITVTTKNAHGGITRQDYRFKGVGSGPINASFRIGDEDPQFDALFAQLKNSTAVHAVVKDTDMRFDAVGLRPNFDMHTHQN